MIRNGKVWGRARNRSDAKWVEIPIKKRMANPKALDTDSELFIVIDSKDIVYTSFGGLDTNYSDIKWTRHWGAPVRASLNMKLPPYCESFSLSYLSPGEDKYYEAKNGNKHDVGAGVTHLFFLSQQGQHITYLDPWLPKDYSYELGTPVNGRFQAAAIASSGSTVMITNKYGDIYTRTYDFDMVGADRFFFKYSWDPKLCTTSIETVPIPREIPRLLPIDGWKQEPKINGKITNILTVVKMPPGTLKRELRVEGEDKNGLSGYYTKTLTDATWSFVHTGDSIKGKWLDNKTEDCTSLTLGPDESVSFTHKSDSLELNLPNFHPYCSPTLLVVKRPDSPVENFKLHSHELIRQVARERGITAKNLKLGGAIESADGSFIPVDITVNSKSIAIKGKSFEWKMDKTN
ncbi:MAG: hypothetical protein JNL74_01400 [Fibrobacteres bacterium]|nr:hypothetical protein [Fibrobacterota bacterium]